MVMDGKKSKFVTVGVALAFLATALVVLPTVSAQSSTVCPAGPVASNLDVEVTDKSGGAIRPITGQGTFDVKVVMSWDQAGKSVSAIGLTYEAKADQGWATVVLGKKSFSKTPDSGATQIDDTFSGTIFLTKDAPAFATAKITVTATGTGGTCILKPQDKTGEAPIQAGFYGKMQARLDKTIESTGQNSKVTIPLIVENYGNGELITRYELVNSEKTDVDVILPPPIIVPTAIGTTLDPKQIINVDIQTPFKNGYMNKADSVTIKVTSKSNDNQEIEGPEAQVTALIRTQGVYVPGFEATTMLIAGLAALAGFVRRQ